MKNKKEMEQLIAEWVFAFFMFVVPMSAIFWELWKEI